MSTTSRGKLVKAGKSAVSKPSRGPSKSGSNKRPAAKARNVKTTTQKQPRPAPKKAAAAEKKASTTNTRASAAKTGAKGKGTRAEAPKEPKTAGRKGRGEKLVKSLVAKSAAGKIPMEIPTLTRWVADDPKARLEEIRSALTKADEERFSKLQVPVRIAVRDAWDENPETFFKLMQPWLNSDSPRLRAVAAGALPLANEEFHDRSVKVLKKLATDPDTFVRNRAIDLLAEEVDRHIDLIKRWANDQDPAVREIVARHLHLTDTPKRVLPILEELTQDKDPDVHWSAARALYDLHEREAKGALEVARKMAASPEIDIRRAVAYSYFEHVFGDNFDHSFLLMRQWVRSGDPYLRWTLAHSLRWAKPNARALQVLRALFEDRDPEIRCRVVEQLREFFPRFEDVRPAAELLRRAKKDQIKKVRDTADEAEARLAIDLDAIPLPPMEGEPGAEAQEPAWTMPIDEAEGAEPVEQTERDDEEDDDF